MQHFYFDHNATTPVAPEVLRDLTGTLVEVCGNASSIHHFGQAAKQRLEQARREIAARLGCDPKEIVFTSGGTESDNLAIFGVVRRALAAGGRTKAHVITSTIEHPAVLNACAQLQNEGAEVTWLPVSSDGVVRLDELKRALRPSTTLVTVMHANNETGVVQPLREIAALVRSSGAVMHSDGVQMGGRVAVNVKALGLDLYSVSGHKFGGPKGIGALYARKGLSIDPVMYGGHHERDRRAGTENVPGASALGTAARIGFDWNTLTDLRDRLENGILNCVPGTAVNGEGADRLPNTSNIRFDGIEGEAIVISLDLRGFAVSSGSACSSGAVEPSHVLLAMGLSAEEARSSVRFSVGPGNTAEEVDGLIAAVAASVAHLRHISPAVSHG
jgi:cysteine desulfurase